MIPLPPPLALAQEATRIPTGRHAYEPKMDGWRASLAHTDDGQVLLPTRAGRETTTRFPELVAAGRALPPGTVLDGEACAWTNGRLDFGVVQRRGLSSLGPIRRPRRHAAGFLRPGPGRGRHPARGPTPAAAPLW